MKSLITFSKHSLISLFMNIDAKFEQPHKKSLPIKVTFEKGDKSIDSNFEQPCKKSLPIKVTFEKGAKSIDVNFEQPYKK